MNKCSKLIKDIHENITTNHIKYSLDKELFHVAQLRSYGYLYMIFDCTQSCNLLYITANNKTKSYYNEVL